MLMCLEGLDAAGKNTQAKRLVDKFDSIGRVAVVRSFPQYATPLGQLILGLLTGKRRLVEEQQVGDLISYPAAPEEPLVLQALFLAEKSHAAHDIEADIYAGRDVICDRWKSSATAFGESDGVDPAWLQQAQELLPNPALNIFIDVPEEEALRRRPQLRDRYEKNREQQKIIYHNYKTIWEAGAEDDPAQWVVVDGVGTIDEVTERIWKRVLHALRLET